MGNFKYKVPNLRQLIHWEVCMVKITEVQKCLNTSSDINICSNG